DALCSTLYLCCFPIVHSQRVDRPFGPKDHYIIGASFPLTISKNGTAGEVDCPVLGINRYRRQITAVVITQN
ncbi:MAG: hypothetical protein D6698_05165, partial [Gammaproteobacteria bacterium]